MFAYLFKKKRLDPKVSNRVKVLAEHSGGNGSAEDAGIRLAAVVKLRGEDMDSFVRLPDSHGRELLEDEAAQVRAVEPRAAAEHQCIGVMERDRDPKPLREPDRGSIEELLSDAVAIPCFRVDLAADPVRGGLLQV